MVIVEARSERQYLVCDDVPVLEPTAAQVALGLRVRERRQRGALLGKRPIERLEVLLHEAVEHRILGTVTNVARAAGERDARKRGTAG